MFKALKNNCGEGYIDICVFVLCAILVLAVIMKVMPVYMMKNKLDTFAIELAREAEIAGRIGSETNAKMQKLKHETGLEPDVSWSRSGRIQLNQNFTLILTMRTNIGLFGGFGSFPVTLTAKASGKSEVYWK